jgi:hypothetical protein
MAGDDSDDSSSVASWNPTDVVIAVGASSTMSGGNAYELSNDILTDIQRAGVHVYLIDHSYNKKREKLVKKGRRPPEVAVEPPVTLVPLQYMLHHIERIIPVVAQEIRYLAQNAATAASSGGRYQRCLLYRDEHYELKNVVLGSSTGNRASVVGPAGPYEDLLTSFSIREAMMAITILYRSVIPYCTRFYGFTDASNTAASPQLSFRPAYLSLLILQVLTEELTMALLIPTMVIFGMPSTSAYSLYNSSAFSIPPDVLRKVVLITLAVAAACTTDSLKQFFTMSGILLVCTMLFAGLGARSYYFCSGPPHRFLSAIKPHPRVMTRKKRKNLSWPRAAVSMVASVLPSALTSFISTTVIPFAVAVATGIATPYMGHAKISQGGKVALEQIVQSALLIAAVYVVSNHEVMQGLLVVGAAATVSQTASFYLAITKVFAMPSKLCSTCIRRSGNRTWPTTYSFSGGVPR